MPPMNPDAIRHLARLSRLDIPESDIPSFQKEFESILAFVGQVKNVAGVEAIHEHDSWRNIFRADHDADPALAPHTPGEYTERLLAVAPEREGNSIVVKKIL